MELRRWNEPEPCCDPEWEAAYERFETPPQEHEKFLARLRRLGADRWPRDLEVVDMAWESLGFTRLEGVDLSESLLSRYRGPAQLYVGDCRRMAFADESRDVICVQGGLHHLSLLPDDLDAVVGEVRRVLRPNGRFVVVEPWLTPFLRTVHELCKQSLARRASSRIEALDCMIRREERTYFQWLARPGEIRAALSRGFDTSREAVAWGKFYWVGTKRPQA
jgi:SAM-dependent methyltransferase